MNSKKKILFLGSCNTTISAPLISLIKSSSDDLYFSVAGLSDYKTQKVYETGAYEEIDECLPPLRLKNQKLSGQLSKRQLSPGKTHSWKTWLKKRIAMLLGGRHLSKKFRKLKNEHDVINLHGLFLSQVHYYLARKKPLPIVVSIWGSDLLRQSDMEVMKIQQQILRNADVINVCGPEFKEILLAKFGRDLTDKIKLAQFAPGVSELLESKNASKNSDFRTKNKISQDAIVICIGHNAHIENQHLRWLRCLENLTTSQLSKLHVIFPLTYGGSDKYIKEIELKIKQLAPNYTLFIDYMSDAEVTELRFNTDVLIYGPISDGFSATVSQALAAGSICMLGGWLPYKLRRDAGLKYWEFNDEDQLADKLDDVLENWEESVKTISMNEEISIRVFGRERLGEQWVSCYNDALNKFMD